MIRVVVADDDRGFRAALVEVLVDDGRFDVVAQAGSGQDAIDLVHDLAPDLVLLDVRMETGGPAAVRAITAVPARPGRHRARVVAVSALAHHPQVLSMLHAGAVGYLVKGSIGHDLPALLVRAAHGEVVLGFPGAEAVLTTLLEGSLLGA